MFTNVELELLLAASATDHESQPVVAFLVLGIAELEDRLDDLRHVILDNLHPLLVEEDAGQERITHTVGIRLVVTDEGVECQPNLVPAVIPRVLRPNAGRTRHGRRNPDQDSTPGVYWSQRGFREPDQLCFNWFGVVKDDLGDPCHFDHGLLLTIKGIHFPNTFVASGRSSKIFCAESDRC